MQERRTVFFTIIIFVSGSLCWTACNQKKQPPKKDIIRNIDLLDNSIQKNIGQTVQFLLNDQGMLSDSQAIFRPSALAAFYRDHKDTAVWSVKGVAHPAADSLLAIVASADAEGLIPAEYHSVFLDSLDRYIKNDSISRRDAAAWAQMDILLTDAFMKLASNLHYGVLPPDSISLRKDHAFTDTALLVLLNNALKERNIRGTIAALEPRYPQYRLLKQALKEYKSAYAEKNWDSLPVQKADSLVLQGLLAIRFLQSGAIDSADLGHPARIRDAIRTFQRGHGLYPDGVAGERTIEALNVSKADRIRQIAVNMERWRHLPDSLPREYLLVNIPSFTLQIWNEDTMRLESRVIVGGPKTQTPLLNSSIINFQLYPYWRVPFSIVIKEMLPAIKRNKGYLASHNLEVIDRHNNPVDPAKLDWNKFNKNYFPYLLRQMTGLDNSLGILKFNFRNKYSVYLHDTNVRGLFGKSFRALSHGCVRVQQWDSLAMYLIRNDTLHHTRDSVNAWIGRQQQKQVNLRQRLPIYIRYFTCRVNEERKLVFYEDVYRDDSLVMKKMYGKLMQ